MLLDEFAGQFSLNKLKQMGDRHPLKGPVKGGFVNFVAEIIFVVSNNPFETWYPYASGADRAAYERRRFTMPGPTATIANGTKVYTAKQILAFVEQCRATVLRRAVDAGEPVEEDDVKDALLPVPVRPAAPLVRRDAVMSVPDSCPSVEDLEDEKMPPPTPTSLEVAQALVRQAAPASAIHAARAANPVAKQLELGAMPREVIDVEAEWDEEMYNTAISKAGDKRKAPKQEGKGRKRR